MKSIVPASAASVLIAILLSGCNNPNSNFRKPLTAPATGAAPVAAQPAADMPSAPAAGKPPYVLSASTSGPFIDFKVYNMGQTDLVVKKEDFALITKDSRSINPYDKSSAVIDIPQPAVVKPNGTLAGRAIFKTVNAPLGHRLVYKPDGTGTYADINPAS